MECTQTSLSGLVVEVLDLQIRSVGGYAHEQLSAAHDELGATRLPPLVETLGRADMRLAPGVGDLGELGEVLVHRRDVAHLEGDVDPIIVDLAVAGEGHRVETDRVLPAEARELLAGRALRR